MRRVEADDFGYMAPSPAACPLFDAPVAEPFDNSPATPEPVERLVAAVIWRHQGRTKPVTIAEVAEVVNLDARKVKEIVEVLRVTHRCKIGAKRGDPAGYFWIVDAEDLKAAVEPYRNQILSMWRTLHVLDSRESMRELLGQMRID